jgi:hippurate hydrolase
VDDNSLRRNRGAFPDDDSLQQQMVTFRRDLHRIPELDFDLPKTRAYLTARLSALECEIQDLGKAGFTAFFAGGGAEAEDLFAGGRFEPRGRVAEPKTGSWIVGKALEAENRFAGKALIGASGTTMPSPSRDGGGESAYSRETIAFRSDMDAIPIDEAVESDFKSVHPGAMHACGHDGHMSILLGFALWVSAHRAQLKTNVMLVFQAAEETTGGAKLICDTGVFSDYGVTRIYGLHLWPGYPAGTVVSRAREFMAGTFVVKVALSGHAAHVAEYRKGTDALEAGCLFVERAYAMEASLPDGVFRLLRFGVFDSGTASNIVADKAVLTGTMRAFKEETFALLRDGMRRIAADITAETGVRVIFETSEGYPAVVNPLELYADAKERLTRVGFEWVELEQPLTQAEDFAHYQQAVPGLFLHLGTGRDAKLHTGDYTLNENVLIDGVRLFRELLG